MKIKTADLIGPALDWAVAQLEGKAHGYKHQLVDDCRQVVSYSPSTNWSQGGPLVDRAGIYFGPLPDKGIRAYRFIDGEYCDIMDCWGAGITRCTVAMRCLVAATLGDEVDVPDELV